MLPGPGPGPERVPAKTAGQRVGTVTGTAKGIVILLGLVWSCGKPQKIKQKSRRMSSRRFNLGCLYGVESCHAAGLQMSTRIVTKLLVLLM